MTKFKKEEISRTTRYMENMIYLHVVFIIVIYLDKLTSLLTFLVYCFQ